MHGSCLRTTTVSDHCRVFLWWNLGVNYRMCSLPGKGSISFSFLSEKIQRKSKEIVAAPSLKAGTEFHFILQPPFILILGILLLDLKPSRVLETIQIVSLCYVALYWTYTWHATHLRLRLVFQAESQVSLATYAAHERPTWRKRLLWEGDNINLGISCNIKVAGYCIELPPTGNHLKNMLPKKCSHSVFVYRNSETFALLGVF